MLSPGSVHRRIGTHVALLVLGATTHRDRAPALPVMCTTPCATMCLPSRVRLPLPGAEAREKLHALIDGSKAATEGTA